MTEHPRRSELAHHWDLDPRTVFLNHGSFGACPRSVLQVQRRWQEQMEREPVRFFERDAIAAMDDAREALGAFVHCDPDHLALISNATSGVNTVLRSLELQPGDELLVHDHIYGACGNAISYVAERAGASVTVARIPFPIASAQEATAAFLDQVTSRTRLALVDQVTSPTALVLPVAEIVGELQSRGVDVLVDAAHGPGIVPLDLNAVGAAYTTGNCHKWLCTPKGAAFLHVREDRQAQIRPLSISHGATQPLAGRSRFRVEFDWTGTDDPTAWMCIPDAIREMSAMMDGGWEAIRHRNRQLTLKGRRVLADALGVSLPCPDEMVSAIATLILPEGFGDTEGSDWTSDPLHERLLDEHRIQVPVFPWPDLGIRCLRISSQLYNHPDEVEHLASVLRTLD